jgi:NAD(P)-dependent dehydrogenase (short-subunit alcohol dehydrogenase family)
MGKLSGKVAIVTGSTSGIGAAVAVRFASEGANVVISGRNNERGCQIKAHVIEAGGIAEFVECDTSQENDIVNLVKQTVDRFGRIDVVFNNAGVFFTGALEDVTTELWDSAFAVNTRGYFLMCKHSMPYLIASGAGVIINNSSVAGLQSYASGRSYVYSATKAAVVQFSRVLALNYAKFGVRVNTICPGIIETPLFDGRDLSDSVKKIPIGRLGKPDDIAALASFLASSESGYITGAVIPIDGGLSI